jgi:ABC-type nitrate/sulfonate/bicarbonate transport system substrate-binding protein
LKDTKIESSIFVLSGSVRLGKPDRCCPWCRSHHVALRPERRLHRQPIFSSAHRRRAQGILCPGRNQSRGGPIPGGTDRIVAALDKGEIDTGKNATPYLIQAVLKGSDAVAIVAQTTNPVYSLIVRPEIKTFADLKGKVIGLSTPGDTITLSTVRLLSHKGVKPADFRSKAVVGTGARFDCLKSSECVAVPMGQPEDLDAIKQGYPRLGFTYESGADLIFNVDMTRRAWGEKNQETLVRFVRGFAASYQCMNDPKNRGEVTNIVRESLKVSDEIAREIFAPYTEPDKNVLPKKGELNLKAFNQVLALMGEAGVIPTPVPTAERFIDLRYLKAAGIQ